jgi:hypothetical protein
VAEGSGTPRGRGASGGNPKTSRGAKTPGAGGSGGYTRGKPAPGRVGQDRRTGPPAAADGPRQTSKNPAGRASSTRTPAAGGARWDTGGNEPRRGPAAGTGDRARRTGRPAPLPETSPARAAGPPPTDRARRAAPPRAAAFAPPVGPRRRAVPAAALAGPRGRLRVVTSVAALGPRRVATSVAPGGRPPAGRGGPPIVTVYATGGQRTGAKTRPRRATVRRARATGPTGRPK